MEIDPVLSIGLSLSQRSIRRGQVLGIDPVGYVLVTVDGHEAPQRCEVLLTSEKHGTPSVGATVLLLDGDEELGEMPVVLGQLGTVDLSEPSLRTAPAASAELKDEVTIEATHQVTLRCGAGAIAIRADGKILIKGKDLVSHAQRMNRIKGGAVAIN